VIGGGRGISDKGGHGFILLYAVLGHVRVSFVEDLRDEKEVLDIFEVAEGGVEVLVAKSIVSEDADCGHKPLSPRFKGLSVFSWVLHHAEECPAPSANVADVLEGRYSEVGVTDLARALS
jgi:hypothetical protein